MAAFARAVGAARTPADLEAVVTAAIGTAGLMEMAHFDIGEVLQKEEEQAPKALRLVIGNPLIGQLRTVSRNVQHAPTGGFEPPSCS